MIFLALGFTFFLAQILNLFLHVFFGSTGATTVVQTIVGGLDEAGGEVQLVPGSVRLRVIGRGLWQVYFGSLGRDGFGKADLGVDFGLDGVIVREHRF